MSDISFEDIRAYERQKFEAERENMYGADGLPGLSAYDIAVEEGFVGTKQQWLDSLKGADGTSGTSGKSAYEQAVDNGFVGTEQQWLDSLKGADGTSGKSAYDTAVENGFVGTEQEFTEQLTGPSDANIDYLSQSGKKLYVDSGSTDSQKVWFAAFTATSQTPSQYASGTLMELEMYGYMYPDIYACVADVNSGMLSMFDAANALSMAGGPSVSTASEFEAAVISETVNQGFVDAYNASGFTGTQEEYKVSLKNRLNELLVKQSSTSGDVLYTGNNPPSSGEYAKCDGSVLSKADYPTLYDKIGLIDDRLTFAKGNINDVISESAVYSGMKQCYGNRDYLVIGKKSATDAIRIFDDVNGNTTLLCSSSTGIGSVDNFDITKNDELFYVSGNQFGMLDVAPASVDGYGATIPANTPLGTLPAAGYTAKASLDGAVIYFYKEGVQGANASIVIYNVGDYSAPYRTVDIPEDINHVQMFGSNVYKQMAICTPTKVYFYNVKEDYIERIPAIESFGEIKCIAPIVSNGNPQTNSGQFINGNFAAVDVNFSNSGPSVSSSINLNQDVQHCDAVITDDQMYLILTTKTDSGTLVMNRTTQQFLNKGWEYGMKIFSPVLKETYALVLHRDSADSAYTNRGLLQCYRKTYNPDSSFALPIEVSKTLNGESVFNYIKLEDEDL